LSHRALAFGVGAVVLAANVISERLLMNISPQTLIPGLADFSPAMNHGVSFSLFTQTTDTGRYLLMAILSVIVIGVLALAWQAQTRLTAAAFGLILGGALGNLLDRALYGGGVFDFLALHLGATPLFVCNLSDIAISAGAVLLVADAFITRGARDFAD
jgi:signal peptidase II